MGSNIAVLLPVYYNDNLNYFQKAVESIYSQTYLEFTLFILVDGPLKNEMNIYLDSLPQNNTMLIRFDVNRGLSYVLNDGIKLVLSKGYAYIARMDADDVCHESRLEKQVFFLEKNLQVDCLGTWVNEFGDDNNFFFIKEMPATHDECYRLFKKRDCLNHPTVIFRRTYFEKAGLYPENTYFAEDTMLWANGFKHGCIFANLQESLLSFRLNKDFFNRRRGWKHAYSILLVRIKVNRMLNYSFDAYIYAVVYAILKLLPNFLLKFAYKFLR